MCEALPCAGDWVMVVGCHQAVLRVLRAYLLHRPRATCHAGSIPQHTVMKITWDGWHFPPLASPLETDMIQKRYSFKAL